MIKLYPYQIDAINKLKPGNILCGGVGSGKSLTALGYYYILCNGGKSFLTGGEYVPMASEHDLYIITTAKKRDTHEWESECDTMELTGKIRITIDSWNNIGKYTDVKNAFFIFDEQRVVGYGAWTKSFLKITRTNKWILLTATPGDVWLDYMPVFIANGFYKNKTEFIRNHVVYDYRAKFPRVDRYIDTGILIRHRNDILVRMDFERGTIPHVEVVYTLYDRGQYREVGKTRWSPFADKPIETASELCQVWRRICNETDDRAEKVLELWEEHKRCIIFYNFNYELDLLRKAFDSVTEVNEWNGQKHEPVPATDEWVYLVQYNAGAEGWNCITTDTIIFFSQNYSYKITQQAKGRIDRLNTPYKDLYYYIFRTHSPIDSAIARALEQKRNFNESKFFGK